MTNEPAAPASSRPNTNEPGSAGRILVLAPVGRDGALAYKVLSEAGLDCIAYSDAGSFHKALLNGAGALLLTEEALSSQTVTLLKEMLAAQPAWSDLPLVLLSGHRENRSNSYLDTLQALGPRPNVTLLERPLRPPTLVTVMRAALRARRRQYEVRDLLGQLGDANAHLEERVEARTRALENSEARFATAVHMSPTPTLIINPVDGCLVEANEAFLGLTGYAREEAVGRTASGLRVFVSRLETVLAGLEQPASSEVELRTKTGELRHALLTGRPLERDGQTYVLAALTDITARKRTEEELMSAIQAVMQDTTWFSRSVMERLAQVRSGNLEGAEVKELTPRERQVLELVAQGKNNQTIAAELGLAKQTVRNYTTTLYEKMGVRSRAEAIVWARERGLVGL